MSKSRAYGGEGSRVRVLIGTVCYIVTRVFSRKTKVISCEEKNNKLYHKIINIVTNILVVTNIYIYIYNKLFNFTYT